MAHNYSPVEKMVILYRIESGETISSLARELGVSRTILYQWVHAYRRAEHKSAAFSSHRRSGKSHWRYIPHLEKTLDELICSYPSAGLEQLWQLLVLQTGKNISKSGLRARLARLHLQNRTLREHYARRRLLKTEGLTIPERE